MLRITIRLEEGSIHDPMHHETPIRTRGSHELEGRDPTRVGYPDLNRGEEHDPKQRERGPRYDPNRGADDHDLKQREVKK